MTAATRAPAGESLEPGEYVTARGFDDITHLGVVINGPSQTIGGRHKVQFESGCTTRMFRRYLTRLLAAVFITIAMMAGITAPTWLWPILTGAPIAQLFGHSLIETPTAQAVPNNCTQQYWLYGLRGTTRTICDGPIRSDGSWLRGREFYAPATWVPMTCSWSRWGGSCFGGYWLPVFDKVDQYIVTPDTVLPDEPGHVDDGTQILR